MIPGAVKEIFFYLFLFFGVSNMVHIGLYLVGANVYDMQRARAKRKRRVHRRRPLVTILIPAYNEERSIVRCLDSVRASRYPQLQIIVVNDASTDATARLLRAYATAHPTMPLQIIHRRVNGGKAAGLNYALRHYARGEYVMTLDADSVLDAQAVGRAVSYFADPQVVGVAANVRIMDQHTPLGILQKFEHMVGYRAKKFYSVANAEFIVGGVASTYRRSVLERVGYYDTDTATEDIGLSLKIVSQGNKAHRIVYGVDVVAATEGVHSLSALLAQRYRWKLGNLQNLVKFWRLFGNPGRNYSKALTWYRIPMAYLGEVLLLTQPFLLGYLLVLSVQNHTTGLFAAAYVTLTIYILWALLPDEHTPWRRKLLLSLYAPFLYFAFYVMDFVQVVSALRCLLHMPTILRRTKETGRWQSPTRALAS